MLLPLRNKPQTWQRSDFFLRFFEAIPIALLLSIRMDNILALLSVCSTWKRQSSIFVKVVAYEWQRRTSRCFSLSMPRSVCSNSCGFFWISLNRFSASCSLGFRNCSSISGIWNFRVGSTDDWALKLVRPFDYKIMFFHYSKKFTFQL